MGDAGTQLICADAHCLLGSPVFARRGPARLPVTTGSATRSARPNLEDCFAV